MIDLLVVGAGPAGLSTAIIAATAGLETVVIEPRSGPIDKACGEGLMPGAVRGFDELGVEIGGHQLAGIRYVRGRYCAEAKFRSGPGRGVRRTDLHAALFARARQVGVRFAEDSVGVVRQSSVSVTAGGLVGRYLVGADGLHSTVRSQVGLQLGASPSQPRRWGQRQHFEITPWTDFVEVHWGPAAELYVTPVADNLVGIAVLGTQRQPFSEVLQQFPQVAQRISGVPSGPVRGAGPLRQCTSARVAGRVLLVGDASGYVDALTGDGIAVSLACARSLVAALLANRPNDYERGWRHQTRRYRLITESLLWARGFRPLNTAIVPAAQRLPRLFSAAVNELAR